jgi:hypothetical protein
MENQGKRQLKVIRVVAKHIVAALLGFVKHATDFTTLHMMVVIKCP